MIKYSEIETSKRLTNEQEDLLWIRAEARIDDDHCIEVDAFRALIREAHVVCENDEEYFGMFVVADRHSRGERFVWLFLSKSDDQACIADEHGADEFEAQQMKFETSEPLDADLSWSA